VADRLTGPLGHSSIVNDEDEVSEMIPILLKSSITDKNTTSLLSMCAIIFALKPQVFIIVLSKVL
jgi:hypothetical protein